MKTMQKVQRGFTLIELMIVVAIIGILAALAIPAYQDYTIKSRVGEGASLMGAYKTAMEVYYSENGTLAGPTGALITTTDLEVTAPVSEYVSSIGIVGTVLQPYFEVYYKNTVALGTAALTCINYYPNKTGANLRWDVRSENSYTTKAGYAVAAATCASGGLMPDKYRPKL